MRHWAEDVAREYLQRLGYELLEENFTTRGGEIDLIMQFRDEIVFVEVRQRRNSDFGTAGESIDYRKLERLRRTSLIYLSRNKSQAPVRFDAVLIEGTKASYTLEHLPAIG